MQTLLLSLFLCDTFDFCNQLGDPLPEEGLGLSEALVTGAYKGISGFCFTVCAGTEVFCITKLAFPKYQMDV